MTAKKPIKKADPFITGMNEFAKDLMDKARGVTVLASGEPPPTLQMRLDVFKALTGWVATRDKLSGQNDEDGLLDDLRRRHRASGRSPHIGEARESKRSGIPVHTAAAMGAAARYGRDYDNGGSALEAIKRALPLPDDGDNGGAGDGSEC
jgi:hypothetical protein